MAAKFVSNRDETVPLFRSPVLEVLTHVHPITPVIVFLPAAAWFGWRSWEHAGARMPALFLGGVVFWTLLEYTLHRFVFHFEPRSKSGQYLHFLLHGIHHDYPRDHTRLVMPPVVSVPLAFAFYFLFRWAFPVGFEGLFAGLLTGYVAYDSIHYATHHWPMKHGIGKFLKEYHLRHHYVDDHRAYGVSTPIWDFVFRTVPPWVKAEEPARE
jgi:sterol desaturase/sphingolipid hydroxylase (fatty acid hydroxylase superfamily)